MIQKFSNLRLHDHIGLTFPTLIWCCFCRVGPNLDFWDFFTEERFLWQNWMKSQINFLRVREFRLLARHNRAKFGIFLCGERKQYFKIEKLEKIDVNRANILNKFYVLALHIADLEPPFTVGNWWQINALDRSNWYLCNKDAWCFKV